MKLVRWFFSNIILIVIVLVLSYSYVYWGRLTDKDTPAGEPLAWLHAKLKGAEGLIAYLKIPDSNDSQTSTSSESDASLPQTDEMEPVVDVEQDIEQDAEPVAVYVTPEIEASLLQVTDGDGVASAPAEQSQPVGQATRELWVNARQSFHHRDFEQSINSYEALIANTSNNYDAYGELGNVYFNQGKMEQAASSYFEAAVILVRVGQTERAASLLGLLNRIDPDRAKELQALLSPAES